jgi:hypothetical protein
VETTAPSAGSSVRGVYDGAASPLGSSEGERGRELAQEPHEEPATNAAGDAAAGVEAAEALAGLLATSFLKARPPLGFQKRWILGTRCGRFFQNTLSCLIFL